MDRVQRSTAPRALPARAGRLARFALGVAVTALALFHGWLLCRRLLDATIGEPEVLLRWLGGAGLLAAMATARRFGLSVSRGRPALVFWLLVLLLHVGASPVVIAGVHARELLLVVPVGLAAALSLAVARRPGAARLRLRPARRARRTSPSPRHLAPGAGPSHFSPRPPPALPAAA